ncbi:MAG: efflux transporter outer membrane subunit [Syntrophorhabdales bacterium]|jgi:NodT family efflux transporter outer membrane factor (OMF) lipoprotein
MFRSAMDPVRCLTVAALAAMLSACAVGPDYHAPRLAVPEAFDAAPAPAPAVGKSPAAAIDARAWWRSFGDPELDSLVERAIRSNPDIEIALDRLQEARTQEAVVMGRAMPEAGASAAQGYGTGSDLTRGRVAPPLTAATDSSGLHHIEEAAGFDAGWEIDVFGRYRREIEASRYDAQAAAEARDGVLVTVVADVVRVYLDMRGLQMELAAALRGVDTARQTLDFVRARYEGGFTNALDLTLAQRELATLRARLAPLAARVRAAHYTIAVLLGQYPEALAGELESPRVIPPIPPLVQAGLPLDLLQRRPDIREAERRLAAATARIGVATAELFPHLALTAAVGVQNPGLAASPGGGNIWSAGPSAFWNFLDFGTLDALVDIADLRTREQLVVYRATVINAVREVDAAISAYTAQRDRLNNLGDALAASRQAEGYASERYRRGLTDFLNVLDAQRQEYDLEDQYAAAQSATADAFVTLYKALGGGWENYRSIPPIRRPQPAIVAAFTRLFRAPVDPQK